jgi:L-ascorbate metabolism protein UlaG (beta-lactamase superfamily)
LLQTSGANVLVDTGLGRQAAAVGAPAGHLATTLMSAGFSPADVDIVVVSHAADVLDLADGETDIVDGVRLSPLRETPPDTALSP